jgi:hypothetical protein
MVRAQALRIGGVAALSQEYISVPGAIGCGPGDRGFANHIRSAIAFEMKPAADGKFHRSDPRSCLTSIFDFGQRSVPADARGAATL